MKTETKVVGAVVLLAGLGGLLFYRNNETKAEREARSQTATKENLPGITLTPEQADRITKLEFKPSGKDKDGKDKEKIVLEKKGDNWELVGVGAKVASTEIKGMLDGLKALKIKDTIDRGTAAYDQYEVADGKGIAFTASAGSEVLLNVVFGSSGSRGQTVRVVGKDGVYVAEGYPAAQMSKEANGWRDKSILKFEDANVASVSIENAYGSYAFTKNGDNWAGTFTKNPNAPAEKTEEPKDDAKKDDVKKDEKSDKKDDAKKSDKKDDAKKSDKKDDAKKEDKAEPASKPGSGWEKFDGKKVENLLRAFKALNATDFASAADTDTGVANPVKEGGLITIVMKDGTSIKLMVGKKQKGSNRFAKKDGDETIYVVSAWAGDWAAGEPKKFEKDEKKEGGGADPHGGAHGAEGMDFDLEGME